MSDKHKSIQGSPHGSLRSSPHKLFNRATEGGILFLAILDEVQNTYVGGVEPGLLPTDIWDFDLHGGRITRLGEARPYGFLDCAREFPIRVGVLQIQAEQDTWPTMTYLVLPPGGWPELQPFYEWLGYYKRDVSGQVPTSLPHVHIEQLPNALATDGWQQAFGDPPNITAVYIDVDNSGSMTPDVVGAMRVEDDPPAWAYPETSFVHNLTREVRSVLGDEDARDIPIHIRPFNRERWLNNAIHLSDFHFGPPI